MPGFMHSIRVIHRIDMPGIYAATGRGIRSQWDLIQSNPPMRINNFQ
uniref:Uncharacterized protein n=1 Tax=Picea sitchensis TaxID=3332 RepID=A0A6B9XUI2_PICSI|nr:hypothetical protein Q903MT_gene4013 [Picea sitchensis]